MRFDTQFSGRIIQVTEALSYEDAVSNQVLALDKAFRSLGLNAGVYTKWHDPRHEEHRRPVESLVVTERDVVIYHCYGHAEHTPQIVRGLYCTRILLYHNITPHEFFSTDSRLRDFCLRGREQLREMLLEFHYFWGDSQYNVDELLSLGAPADRCAVVPIIVTNRHRGGASRAQAGEWIFVGRIAPNKNQLRLVQLFAEVRHQYPEFARRLHLVGGYDDSDAYFQQLQAMGDSPALDGALFLHGKVSDDERDRLVHQADIFVSMSEHEGFGVPLIESAFAGLPVAALASSAVPETLGGGPGLASDPDSLKRLIVDILRDVDLRARVLGHQSLNALNYSRDAVAGRLVRALAPVLPAPHRFRTVSVVICTYNRRDYLERVLDYLGEQSCGDFEVVIIDGPSNDGTRELLAKHEGRIKFGTNPERNLAKSRNLGIELATGDIIAFIDDDALPFDDWVESILTEYNTRPLNTAGLGGPAYYAGTFWFQAEDNGINRCGEAKVNIASDMIGRDGWYRYNTGTNATFNAAILRAAGGFDEQFDYYLDESEVCYRLQLQGWLIGYSASVVVRHEFAQSHNRQGKLNYNWHTICKNTTYFICAYSGLEGKALTTYIERRMFEERIAPMVAALNASEIGQTEHDRHVHAIRSGVEQGLEDAKLYPRRRQLRPPTNDFLPFAIRRTFPSFTGGRKRLHVCIISKEFPPFAAGGGVGTLYYHLASELLMNGHKVTIIVPGEKLHIFKQGNMRVHFTPLAPVLVEGAEAGFSRNVAWSLSALNRLASIHTDDPVDIVDSALWDAEALAVALIPSKRRPKVVVRLVTPYALASQINGWQPNEATSDLFMSAERALINAADAVVPISESIAKSIETIYGLNRDERWTTIPCGIAYWPFFDVNQGYNEFPQLQGLPAAALASRRMVLFLGRLERRKGIDLVLEAAPEILASDPTIHIVLAGRDVEGWAKRDLAPNLRSRVHFVGEVDNATREKLLARAYCLLFPSRYESFGLVPLEGFVHGVPVVAARAGAIPEVVEEGISGLLFREGCSDSLAATVIEILQDPILRENLSIGARLRVRAVSSKVSAILSNQLYEGLLR